MYVEPTAFVADGESAFLAGYPNYLFRGDSLLARDAIFGVVWRARQAAQTVQSPLAGRKIGDVRLAALGQGRFAAVFAELAPDRPFLENQHAMAMWFAVFDGTSWTKPEKLPAFPHGVVRSSAGSALIVNGDGISIAYPLDSVSPTMQQQSDVGVFTRRRDAWSSAVIPIWMAGGVSLTSVGALGLRLAVVQPDTTQQSDGGSVFLFGPGPGWANLAKLISGGESYTDDPIIHASDGYLSLSWHSRLRNNSGFGVARTARAPLTVRDKPAAPVDHIFTFDSSSVRITALVRKDRQFWISEHVFGQSGGALSREFRIYADSAGIPVLVGHTPDNFDGTGFAAELLSGPPGLAIVGPVLYRTKTGGRLATRVLVLPFKCRR